MTDTIEKLDFRIYRPVDVMCCEKDYHNMEYFQFKGRAEVRRRGAKANNEARSIRIITLDVMQRSGIYISSDLATCIKWEELTKSGKTAFQRAILRASCHALGLNLQHMNYRTAVPRELFESTA